MATIIDKFVTLLDYRSNTSGIKKASSAMKHLDERTKLTERTMDGFKEALIGVGLAFGIEKIIELANEWQNVSNRLLSTGLVGKQLISIQNKLLDLSDASA